MKTKGLLGAASFLFLLFLLQGCGFGNDGSSEEMDAPPPQEDPALWEEELIEGEPDTSELPNEEAESEEAEKEKSATEQEETEEGTVERELYLMSETGLVVPHTFSLPKEEGVLQQSLEYLVKDGPLTSMLPNGFQAVLPPGTEVDVHLTEEGTAIADFSPEFRDYDPNHEQAMLEAITWTLTQFENVDEVKVQINGYEQETMPVADTPIGTTYSRENGINLESSHVSDMMQSNSVTLYFLTQAGDESYFVPVTRRVNTEEEKSLLDTAINELVKGPHANSSLHGVIREGAALEAAATVEGDTASLVFNESLLTEQEGTAISQETLHAIALTATEMEGIENINLSVEGMDNVMEVSGDTLSEPLARPAAVNAAETSH
ncbi:GerMN domain-containing protein [Alteribacillus iranensis]|uniref:Germination protein M n=1 Tax=Alteribacillus iranensis TaxID=930128 RepID=A0A1I2CNQ3_9BACI|nr:GerMN domain-containing protein [Alteribacillus iranensis]SFE69413.1 germination protein M [Alteribacillus iranensis]